MTFITHCEKMSRLLIKVFCLCSIIAPQQSDIVCESQYLNHAHMQ